jgi:hypothetical protein
MADSHIITSGALSIGDTAPAGSGLSLNRLRNYRDGTAVVTPTSVGTLGTFFSTYTQNSTIGAVPYKFSQFRNGLVFRISIDEFTQCSANGSYHNQSNGILRLTVRGGSGGNFTFTGMTANQTVSNGAQVSWTNLAGSYTGNTRGDYSLTITDVNTGVAIAMTLVRCWETGYGTSFIRYQSVDRNRTDIFWNRN